MGTLVKYTEKGATPSTPSGTEKMIPDKCVREMLERGFVELVEGEETLIKEKVNIDLKKEKKEIQKPGKSKK